MGFRLSKIYTRKGDDGTTSLDAKNRLPKNHPRVEAIGMIDELNSAIGLVISFKIENSEIEIALLRIQQDLFNLGGELCPPYRPIMTAEAVTQLENEIDRWNEELPPLKEFILPGGNPKSASCHLARTICRRAERALITLFELESFNKEIIRYINRLSDVLFVAARMLGRESHSLEILWDHQREPKREK